MKPLKTSLMIGAACCLIGAANSQAATLLGLYDSIEGQGLYVFDTANPWYGNSFYLSGIGAGEIFIADFDGHNAQAVTADNVICSAPS